MSYFCAGIYAEGSTDERFLCRLVDRLLHEVAYDVCPGQFEIGETQAIQEPKTLKRPDTDRATRIAAAIEHAWGPCTLFIIHADADDDSQEKAFEERVRPGLEKARQKYPNLAAAPCIPVHETEAWMLADPDAFRKIFERPVSKPLPYDLESIPDPKTHFENTLRAMGVAPGRGFEGYEESLGDLVRFESLRRLSAFRQFESNLRAEIKRVVHHVSA